MNKYLKLSICLILPQIIAFLGAISTFSSVKTWYLTLEKPFFNPPNWIFGPVWTVLYIMMGLSSYFIWQKQDTFFKSKALRYYLVNLFFNFCWSYVFFGLKSPFFALLIIIILLSLIFICIKIFYSIDRKASFMLYPYAAWVSFATILNFAIWYLN